MNHSTTHLLSILVLAGLARTVHAAPPTSAAFSDPAVRAGIPETALGWPRPDPKLDAYPGFRTPPPGYGEVPFWWWTGEDLDAERLIGQLRELHRKGISGVQVNYSHYDTPGWLTEHADPPLFTDAWWKIYGQVSAVAGELDMGIGLSTYTIDWPRGAKNLFYELFYSKPELNAIELRHGLRRRVQGGETVAAALSVDRVAVRAYPVTDDKPGRGGQDLSGFVKDNRLDWTAPEGTWEVWEFVAARQPGSMNPMMPGAGETVVRGFFQQFEDRNPGGTAKGLNYFFNDELHIGVDKFAWHHDFAEQFALRKGYDLFDALPAMWIDAGDITPKVRMDYADVRMALMEERYFKPIHDWHASRGMIYGCDSGGRGLQPNEFGDYFRATRWYTAPGHDTPGGRADPIKGKVSSSVANLYRQPRVWLEGYHSLGWHASPEQLMFATRENYLYGCTLLNLHGLYYTTYGSHWEWAPPCYHFRMPYWEHMDVFLRYFDRMSYLLSQGHFVADVAIVYPVAPYEAEMNGDAARQAAFDLGARLMQAGVNFEFIDNDSLARAVVRNGRLEVEAAGASYQALVFPNMQAVRWPSIEKAAAFAGAGGRVYAVGALPSASDRAGRNDPELAALNDRAFAPERRLAGVNEAVAAIRDAFVQDVQGLNRPVRALHRRVGPREVYMVMDAHPGDAVEFRARGAVELWDAWTGMRRPLRVLGETETGSQVELELQPQEAQLVVFTPGQPHVNPPLPEPPPVPQKALDGDWTVAFVPTMDNTHGDFRLPATEQNRIIGVEARRFAWTPETRELRESAYRPETDDNAWPRRLHGHGTRFYVLGPVPEAVPEAELDAHLAALRDVNPAVPVKIGDQELTWRPYDFSWRYGIEGNPGHQGYHGLKGRLTDDFIGLGRTVGGHNETRIIPPEGGGRYYLWTTVTAPSTLQAEIITGAPNHEGRHHTSPIIQPAAVYVGGQRLTDLSVPFALTAGRHAVLIRYDQGGRGHMVVRRHGAPAPTEPTPLAMQWYDDPAVLPMDVVGTKPPAAEWFRFVSAPGTKAIHVTARGRVSAWIDGRPMRNQSRGRFDVATAPSHAAVVALRVEPEPGWSGGAALVEPVAVETDGTGRMALGNWAGMGILNNYSGGVRYRTTFTLTDEEAEAAVQIDLSRLCATAEVTVNGESIGVRVAPPWTFNVAGQLKPGENTIEVLVYNTLSNHYQTIPTNYRGDPLSGLIGPVRLMKRNEAKAGTGTTDRMVRAMVRVGTAASFRAAISANATPPAVAATARGTRAHEGGGTDFTALFNGTAGNPTGTDATMNDGKTFVGMARGNTLDLALPPAAVVREIRTYSGHDDVRASQRYRLLAATADAPDTFLPVAEVSADSPGGLVEVRIARADQQPLLTKAVRLRFEFEDGPSGFCVYREIAIGVEPGS